MESYNFEAYYYLLKPVNAASLYPLLDKVASELSEQEEQGFVLKSRKGVVKISFAKLEYVEVINKTVFFYLSNGITRETTATLADFEDKLLSRPEFLKTHRSYIVNLNYVQAINADGIITKNGYHIPVSRQRRSQIQDTYMQFQSNRFNNMTSFEESKHHDGPWKILLVDDASTDRTFWADILRCHGCIVSLAEDGESALKFLTQEFCDCILLDVLLPDGDGFDICKKMRKLTQAPIIFLSCITESDKQVEGFAVGGTDYITKDTPAELFWAKVETRIKLVISDRTQIRYGPLLLDLKNHKILLNEKDVCLTPVEFDILWHLSEHSEHIFTPEEIFNIIWRGQPWDGGQMVQMHMSRLRRKLEDKWNEHHFIETVWGQGYHFVPIR